MLITYTAHACVVVNRKQIDLPVSLADCCISEKKLCMVVNGERQIVF